MAAKLKSILKPIPWFLAARAVLFGFAWLFLPLWLFVALGLYFYFFPFFQSWKLIFPFCLTLIFGILATPSIPAAFFLTVVFFLILGIRDLFFINRIAAYELLVFLLLFLFFLNFFEAVANWQGMSAFFWSLILSITFFLLVRSFVNYADINANGRTSVMVIGVGSLLLWQLSIAVLILPLTFFSQAALLFLAAAFIIDFSIKRLDSRLNRRDLMANAVAFAVLATIIFSTTRWEL